MKKIISLLLVMLVLFSITNNIYAADEYSFDLKYVGEIIQDEPKDAVVLLTGINGPTYSNVRIKVDITGPATPKLIAKDSEGNDIDVAQTKYWGPPEGFAVARKFYKYN